ncbi:hypothetical protein L3X38_003979 [Prunus dulcis]|uniref:Uncharacterized protein n=1 Tax=Prunus dulcis TaxID=3755 RepID=A0AAD4ZN25_PRUDU|nr:hypothetical protein L3X38_003979 [Prunus dulcis]
MRTSWATWTTQMEMIPSMPLKMETSGCSVLTYFLCRDIVNMEGAEEQKVKDAVAEENEAEEDAANEVVTDIADQAGGAAENVAAQA